MGLCCSGPQGSPKTGTQRPAVSSGGHEALQPFYVPSHAHNAILCTDCGIWFLRAEPRNRLFNDTHIPPVNSGSCIARVCAT